MQCSVQKNIQQKQTSITQLIIIHMLDQFSDLGINQNSSFVPSRYLASVSNPSGDHNSRLPKIEKEKQIVNTRNRARTYIRSSTKLPNLKIEPIAGINKDKTQTHQGPVTLNRQNNKTSFMERHLRQKSEGDEFAYEIEKKLKLVLDGHNVDEEYAEASNSDEEFERKISLNKEKIKKERLRREALNESSCEQNNSQNINNALKHNSEKRTEQRNGSQRDLQRLVIASYKPKLQKQDILYEKRMKDYKEEALGNKFLIKKKEVVLKEYNVGKKGTEEEHGRKNSETLNLKSKSPIKTSNKKSSNMLINVTRDEDLFENLHSILLNPSRKSENDILNEKRRERHKNNDKGRKTQQNLIEQMKLIETRLGEQRKQDLDLLQKIQKSNKSTKEQQQTEVELIKQNMQTIKEDNWRKIDVTNSELQVKRTNFEQQIQRINKYFQRNERSLQKHIENTKLLYNLNSLTKKKVQDEAKKIA